MYEMVTGGVPYSAETPMAVVVKHITEPLPLPHTINPDLPEAVERVILRALAKAPDDRYETAGKMAAALRKVVAGLDTAMAEAAPVAVAGAPAAAPTILEEGGATQVVPAPAKAPPPQPAKKRRVPIWAVVAAGALALVTLFGFCALAGRAGKERDAKATQTAVAQAAIVTTPAPPPAATPSPSAQPPLGSAQPSFGTPAPPPVETPAAPSAGETPPPPADALAARVRDFIKQNPPVFKDDFGDPNSGWKVADDEHGALAYEDSSYVIRVPEIVGKRNMVHLMPKALVLHKFVNGQGPPQLTSTEITNPPQVWHTVDIIARGGHIEVALDGQTVIKYDDPEPLGPGTVAFENGDPPARNQVDDVLIEPAGP